MALVISSKVRARNHSGSKLSVPETSHGSEQLMRRVGNPGSALIQSNDSSPIQEQEPLFERYLIEMQDRGIGSTPKSFIADSAAQSVSGVPFVPMNHLFLASASRLPAQIHAGEKSPALRNTDRLPSSVPVRNATLGRLNREAVYSAQGKDAAKDASSFTRYNVSGDPVLTLLAQANTQSRTALRLLMS